MRRLFYVSTVLAATVILSFLFHKPNSATILMLGACEAAMLYSLAKNALNLVRS